MPTGFAADLAAIDVAGGGAIFEPVGRNTAAAVAVATLQTLVAHGDGAGAGRSIRSRDFNRQAVLENRRRRACLPHTTGRMVVFGIKPTQPETGYGYIEVDDGEQARLRCLALRRKARPGDRGALSRQRHVLLEHRHLPVPRRRHAGRVQAACSRRSGRPRRLPSRPRPATSPASTCRSTSMQAIPSTSIDYAIMEKAERHRDGAGGFPLERPRFLAVAARRQPVRRGRQCHRRRCRRDRLREFLFPQRQAGCFRRSG